MQSCLPTDTPSDFTVAGLGPTLSLKEGLDLNDLTNPNCSGKLYCDAVIYIFF